MFVGLDEEDGPWIVCEEWKPTGFGHGDRVLITLAELHRPVVFARSGGLETSWRSVYALKSVWVFNHEDAFLDDVPLSTPVS